MRLSQNAFLLTRARFRQIVKRGTICVRASGASERFLEFLIVLQLCYVYTMFPAATAVTFQATVDKTGRT